MILIILSCSNSRKERLCHYGTLDSSKLEKTKCNYADSPPRIIF